VEEKDLLLPRQFTVLTYIPDERWAFYGGAQLIEAAHRLPQVKFVVVAGRGGWLHDTPENVTFLGWRNDMVEVYKNSTVVLRLAEHDALGCTVVEGLGMARHVLYNYPVPFAIKVDFDDTEELVAAIEKLWSAHIAGTLLPNLSGRQWVQSAYDQERLIKTLCKALVAGRGSDE
jgi:glycosyltransferase involved in cell wall biosynthesis